MKKYWKLHLILVIATPALLLNRCGSNKVVPNICFTKYIQPIFVSRCGTSGCHDGGVNARGRRLSDFTTYEGIKSKVSIGHPLLSEVYTKCTGLNPSMPPSPNPKLTSTELDYIKYWIHTGAKNSDCIIMECDSSDFNFSTKVQPIINFNCVGSCHNSTKREGNYDFSNYEGVKSAITAGKLMGCIRQSSGFKPMPTSGKLDNCSIRLIQKWIDGGYTNN